MDAQRDYETEPTIAVFDSPEEAHRAVEQLRARRFDIAAIEAEPLAPGRYQEQDASLWELSAGLVWGALMGAPVGLLLGLGQMWLLLELTRALSVPTGPVELYAVLGAGILGGAMLGGYIGAMQRMRFDDDEAEWIEVPGDATREVVAVYTSGPSPRIRQALRRSGALGFLDPTIPATEQALRWAQPA